jgi:hypothetical protein
MKRPRDSNIDVCGKGRVNRTLMTRIRRIDADKNRKGAASSALSSVLHMNVRDGRRYGTGSVSDLSVYQ